MLRSLAVYLLFASLGATPAIAADTVGVTWRVQKTIEDFNSGNLASLSDDIVDAPQIIDDFPPFSWGGRNALRDWNHAFESDAARRSIVKTSMRLLNVTHVDVQDNSAYVVVPAICYFTLRDGHSTETGLLTLVLTQSAETWRISAMSWTKDKD